MKKIWYMSRKYNIDIRVTMDIKGIQRLIDLVKKNNVAELEISHKGETVHIVLNRNLNKQEPPAHQIEIEEEKGAENNKVMVANNQVVVKSPMVGIVYLSSAPGTDVFVEEGQQVKVGDTLCVIEAMKMFNRIEADREGKVVKILVGSSQPVEYGQELFILE